MRVTDWLRGGGNMPLAGDERLSLLRRARVEIGALGDPPAPSVDVTTGELRVLDQRCAPMRWTAGVVEMRAYLAVGPDGREEITPPVRAP